MRNFVKSYDGLNKSPCGSGDKLQEVGAVVVDERIQFGDTILYPEDGVEVVLEEYIDAEVDADVDKGAGLVADVHDWSEGDHVLYMGAKIVMQDI